MLIRRIANKASRVLRGTDGTIGTWPEKERIRGAMRQYLRAQGDDARFDVYHPVLFNEKVISYKLLYHRDGLVNVVDKYLFKDYIRQRLGEGHTIPMFGAWDSLEGLEKAWDSLPKCFVLKSTLQSDGRFIKVIRDKDTCDFNELKVELADWLNPRKTLINSYCHAYYQATPRILAEEYMENIADQLYDYKIFCFDGKPYCFYVATNHFQQEDYPITFYDLDWKMMDVTYGHHRRQDVEKPAHMEEMIEIARKLSVGFPFVRVDFFDLPDKLYCAELTLYPGGGMTLYYPEEFNKQLGQMFHFPE